MPVYSPAGVSVGKIFGLIGALLLGTAAARAQAPVVDWPFENGYRDQMLYLHALVNYSFDVDSQFEWERRRFVSNALRIRTGSVSSNELLTDVELELNESLNDDWRFRGRFVRSGLRQEPTRDDLLLAGLERRIFGNGGVYLAANPEFDKEFLDVAMGYTWYGDEREQYVRVGLLLEDLTWGSKNAFGGEQDQRPVSIEWALRQALPGEWWLYSEGRVGSGFERSFADPVESPDVTRHDRRASTAELRLTRQTEQTWSLWADWYDFSEQKAFRQAGLDYDYASTVFVIGAEHTRPVGERRRLRLVATIVDQQSRSVGFNGHDYDRSDVFAGAFYELLRASGGITFAYAFGQPDIAYAALDPADSYRLDDFRDKIIVAYRHRFSDDAQIRLSLSHEVSAQGFGGGALQFQLFF